MDFDADRLAVVRDDGRHFEYSPKRLSGVEVFRVAMRRFAAGDRIQLRARDRALGIANGRSKARVQPAAPPSRLDPSKQCPAAYPSATPTTPESAVVITSRVEGSPLPLRPIDFLVEES